MKSILAIIPFENVYPPMNGGMMRCMNLLDQMAKHFHLTIIIRQEKSSFLKAVEEYPALKNSTVYSTTGYPYRKDIFSLLPAKIASALRFRFWNRSLNGPAEGNFLLMYPILLEIFKKEKFHHVILEDMAILNIAKVIRRYQPEANVIYDAYNVNTRLAEISLAAGQISRKNFDQMKAAESNISKFVDQVFTCSDQDYSDISEMNNGKLKGMVIPNGVSIHPWNQSVGEDEDENYNILFCGSLDYLPNVEGLTWFYIEAWPQIKQKLPSAKLTVIGSGVPDLRLDDLRRDPSIVFAGRVPDVTPYYREAAVSIVPLLSGSGTRLKILEAMSKGVAIVSTAIGAEGIAYNQGENIIIADNPKLFAEEVINLLKQKEKRRRLQQKGRELVELHYDWNIIGTEMARYLDSDVHEDPKPSALNPAPAATVKASNQTNLANP